MEADIEKLAFYSTTKIVYLTHVHGSRHFQNKPAVFDDAICFFCYRMLQKLSPENMKVIYPSSISNSNDFEEYGT